MSWEFNRFSLFTLADDIGNLALGTPEASNDTAAAAAVTTKKLEAGDWSDLAVMMLIIITIIVIIGMITIVTQGANDIVMNMKM